MKKISFSLLLLLISVTFCKAFELDSNRWTDFSGKLGDAAIQLSLYRFENGEVKGNYCYKKYEKKIQLSGRIEGNQIVLTEFINGKENGTFKGKLLADKDNFEGTWTNNNKTRTANFELGLSAICGGNYEYRYSDFPGTDADVENFMKHVKTSIIKGEKEWIATHTTYPFKTSRVNGKSILIKNKKELIANFNQVFHPAYKAKIKETCTCNLFNNYHGVMLGNGEVWINDSAKSGARKPVFKITAINNGVN